ncbi:helix-turn-helix domain-containing protein [Candidatus Uhrbacteria bacterium]|nr:helix-turn-helix domain-containing protein [Candidatus Uhrbacteria bacterium]
MAKYNEKRIPYQVQDRLLRMLAEILCRLKNTKMISDFLKDLLNRQERAMLVRRLLIAEMLMNGYKYREIVKKLHCGMMTIARVERWLHFGRGGYERAIHAKRAK